MKRNRFALLIGLLIFSSVFTVLAQSDTVKHYTSKDVAWRVHETVDYQAKPEKGSKSFLGVSTDADGKIYVEVVGGSVRRQLTFCAAPRCVYRRGLTPLITARVIFSISFVSVHGCFSSL